MLKDINTGTASASPAEFTLLGTNLIFRAYDVTNGVELWTTDGTFAGTTLLKDIYAGANSSFPYFFYKMGSNLYFSGTDAANGSELWKTDGTAAGTTLVKDINPGNQASMSFAATQNEIPDRWWQTYQKLS
jgi:ELWxxDGT repeat protein